MGVAYDLGERRGKSPKVMRWVLSGVLTEVEKAGFRAYIGVVKGTAFLNRKLGSKIAMRTASQSLKLVAAGQTLVCAVEPASGSGGVFPNGDVPHSSP